MKRKEALALNSEGMVLVLTLMVISIITAVVVEFAYGVYVSTSALHNWKTAQSLSIMAQSSVRMVAETIAKNNSLYSYTYPGQLDLPYSNPLKNTEANLLLHIEDENAKFNLNSLVYPNGRLNESAYLSFISLLKALDLKPEIADRVADWIDPDVEPRLQDSEEKAKNGFLSSVDELLLIRGIDEKSYNTLLPYVTIYGNGLININGAAVPVLMSLSDGINKEMAQRIVSYRESTPFERAEGIMKIAGFEIVGTSLMGRITVKGGAFHIVATASSAGVHKSVDAVLDISGSSSAVRYWKEM